MNLQSRRRTQTASSSKTTRRKLSQNDKIEPISISKNDGSTKSQNSANFNLFEANIRHELQ